MASGSGSGGHAKWKYNVHKMFVELCYAEVMKGNRVGTTLNKEGWNTVHNKLKNEVPYNLKQFKNHWDLMKADYQLYKKLMFRESGIGWNEVTHTLEADPIWWLQKIEENPKYGKYKNKDLSLYSNYYDSLFGYVVATGVRAKAPTTYSSMDLEAGQEYNEPEDDNGEEGSGESDDNTPVPPSSNLFPSVSLKSGKSSGKSSGSKRKKSGAEFVRESIDGLVAAMSSKSTSSTAASNEESVGEALDILDNMEEINEDSDLYTYARRYLLHAGNRILWKKARNNNVRYRDLVYSFNNFNNGGSNN